jgi:hypothetical protein
MTDDVIAYCFGFHQEEFGTAALMFIPTDDIGEFMSRVIGLMGYNVMAADAVDSRFPHMYCVFANGPKMERLRSQFEAHPQIRVMG